MSSTTININFPNVSAIQKSSYVAEEICDRGNIDRTYTPQLLNNDLGTQSFLSAYTGDPKANLVITSIQTTSNALTVEYNSSVITNQDLPLSIDISALNDTDIIPNLELKYFVNGESVSLNTDTFTIFFYITDENGTASSTISSTFQIYKLRCTSVPVITSTLPITSNTDGEVNYQIVATNDPISYYIDPLTLPPGLTLDPLTGLITGTSKVNASYNVDIVVTNNVTSSTTSTTITINRLTNVLTPPVITSPLTVNIDQFDFSTANQFSYQITATNSPTSYGFILPQELVDAGFFTFPGVPNVLRGNTSSLTPGTYTFTISATNDAGTDTEDVDLIITSLFLF